MKLNEFLSINDLRLKIFVCSNGKYRVDFYPLVEIKEGIFLRSGCGDGSSDLLTAISNTLNKISNKTIKIDNKRYVKVLNVTL